MPKSVTMLTPNSSNMMLSGLMSRWTMPRRDADPSAPPVSARIRRISGGVSLTRRASSWVSDWPRRNFMTKYVTGPCFPTR